METFYCDKNIYHYFQDYLEALDIKVIFENPENADVFVQKVPKNVKTKDGYWVLNTEQATRDDIKILLKEYPRILDYSEENIFILKNIFPYKTFKHLSYPLNSKEIYNIPKSKWIAMVGNNSPRRKEIEYKLWNISNIKGWGKDRDLELFKHKILINVHYDQRYKITEQLRVNRCIFNKMIVISENSEHQDLLKIRDKIIFCKYEDIVKVATIVMKNYKKCFDIIYNCENSLGTSVKLEGIIGPLLITKGGL